MADSTTDPRAPDPTTSPDPDASDNQVESTIDFPMPEGFQPPKGTKPGATFEALATLSLGDDGELNLLKLDGCDVKPEEPEPAHVEDDDQSALDSAKAALPATGLPSGMGMPAP
jgi:hypothetical protein